MHSLLEVSQKENILNIYKETQEQSRPIEGPLIQVIETQQVQSIQTVDNAHVQTKV